MSLVRSGLIFYIWLKKVSTNETRHYICNKYVISFLPGWDLAQSQMDTDLKLAKDIPYLSLTCELQDCEYCEGNLPCYTRISTLSTKSTVWLWVSSSVLSLNWVNTLRLRQNGSISQMTDSIAFSWMKIYEFRLKFHWSLFLRFQLTIFQHWFK